MILTTQQAKTYSKYKEYGKVEVDAPRRSGKTSLCRYIIENEPEKTFSIFTLDYQSFKMLYGDLPNTKYRETKNIDVFIGDEVYLDEDIRLHNDYIIVRTSMAHIWNGTMFSNVELKRLKREIPCDSFIQELGKYNPKSI